MGAISLLSETGFFIHKFRAKKEGTGKRLPAKNHHPKKAWSFRFSSVFLEKERFGFADSSPLSKTENKEGFGSTTIYY